MKRAAVGILLASLFTASAAMAGQGYAAVGRDDRSHERRDDRRDDRRDERHDDRRHDARDDHRNWDRGDHGRGRVVYVAPPVRYVRAPAPAFYGTYRRPVGFYDHVWHRGERLPVSFYQRPYVVADYHVHGLRVPPRGYHWVRVNHDAVLALITTGVVLDIAYNLFH